jgi:hypothetical protein
MHGGHSRVWRGEDELSGIFAVPRQTPTRTPEILIHRIRGERREATATSRECHRPLRDVRISATHEAPAGGGEATREEVGQRGCGAPGTRPSSTSIRVTPCDKAPASPVDGTREPGNFCTLPRPTVAIRLP